MTVPVHNEAKLLRSSIERLEDGLTASGLSYTLSIVEDGSTDRTIDVITTLQQEYPALVARTCRNRLGRGLALRRIWSEMSSDIYVFVDADLASGPESVLEVVEAVRTGADVATGSRYCPGAVVHRPPLRRATSIAYNKLVRLLFDEGIRDHQCGLKAFRGDALQLLLSLSKEDSWAWDTEALVLAVREGLKVVEVPIEWTEHRSTRTPIGRLVSDVMLHGEAITRLWRRSHADAARPDEGPQPLTSRAEEPLGARGAARESFE